jgi:hypothetical protein
MRLLRIVDDERNDKRLPQESADWRGVHIIVQVHDQETFWQNEVQH